MMEFGITFIILACVFGLFMAWGVGANDVANAMATSVGSKALTIKQAIIIAAVFEFLGAFLAGGQVTATIRKGMIDAELMAGSPELLVYGMLAALPPENQVAGNLYWITRNESGKLLASGVYIWKCIMPERGDFWGKLVIIR